MEISACVSSALSVYYRHLLNQTMDRTWALMPVNTVTLTEMFVGIICASTPSAAKSSQAHLPVYSVIKSYFTSRFSSVRSSIKLHKKEDELVVAPAQLVPYSNFHKYADVFEKARVEERGKVSAVVGTGHPNDAKC